MNYILSTYGKAYLVNDAEIAVRHLRQLRFSIQEDADELTERVLKFGDIFDDSDLMESLVEDHTGRHTRQCAALLFNAYVDADARLNRVCRIDRRPVQVKLM